MHTETKLLHNNKTYFRYKINFKQYKQETCKELLTPEHVIDVQAQTRQRRGPNKKTAKRINGHNTCKRCTVSLQRRGVNSLYFRVLLEQARHLAAAGVGQRVRQIPLQVQTQVRRGWSRANRRALYRGPRRWPTLFRFLRIPIRILGILILFPLDKADGVRRHHCERFSSVVFAPRLHHDGARRVALFSHNRIPERDRIVFGGGRSRAVQY